MKFEDPNEHLSRITTLWSLVYRAHGGESQAVTAAQRSMIERYSGAVHRYLHGALRDSEAADELPDFSTISLPESAERLLTAWRQELMDLTWDS